MEKEMIEKRDVIRNLKTFFTDKERLSMAEQFANCHRERSRLEDEFTSIKKQYASDIGKQEAEISSIAERLNTGWEMRRVDCVEIKDFNNGSVKVFRKDMSVPHLLLIIGEMVEERPMNAEERQQKLPFEERVDEETGEILGLPIGKGDEVDAEFTPESLQDAPEGAETVEFIPLLSPEIPELVDSTSENPEIIDKTPSKSELAEDTNPFYTKNTEEEPEEKPKRRSKRSLVLPG